MNYLLDTCVLSEFVKKSPNQNVIQWIEKCDEDTLYLSVLSIGEIQKGIAKLADVHRKTIIQTWLETDLRNRFAERLIPVNEEIAITWGTVQGEAEANGITLPTIDGLLSATALTCNLIIVTRNGKDMITTGVKIFNPWDDARI